MNLLTETLQIMQDNNKTIDDIECAYVHSSHWADEDRITYLYGEVTSLESLNFNYDNGYGGQNIDGWISFKDGTWLSRGEYDGSEWWDYNRCPGIEDLI